jgi:hypothetical protein
MSSNSSSRTTWFCRPNHNDQSKPYLNGLCCRSDLRVRTPSLRVHITCQRAWIDSGDQIRPEPPILAMSWLRVKGKHRKANDFACVAGPKTRPDHHTASSPIIFRRGAGKSTAGIRLLYSTRPALRSQTAMQNGRFWFPRASPSPLQMRPTAIPAIGRQPVLPSRAPEPQLIFRGSCSD